MKRHLPTIFALLAALLVADIAATLQSLPEPVATHFDGSGRPNDWMTRDGYAIFMVAFGVGLPLGIVVLIRFAARRFPGLLNVPNRDYWLSAERRQDSLDFLAQHAWGLACLMELFVLAIHRLLLAANTSQPVALPLLPFLAVLGFFLCGLAAWIIVLFRRFRRIA